MRLLLKSALFHFQTHWSNKANFWSGILGMLVNNSLTLLGIWAMLFAGKDGLVEARDSFFVMNFILMLAWGLIHLFLGGIANLDTQISQGGLDLAMTAPRSPFFMLSLTSSQLPAWGDLILGAVGLGIFAVKWGGLFFAHAVFISAFASLALYSFFLFVGCLAFWFRRTEAAHSVLINMCLAFNTYPIFDGAGSGFRWGLFFAPILLVGVVPAAYLRDPSLYVLGIEAVGSILLFLAMRQLFFLGMKKYQSASVLGLQRM